MIYVYFHYILNSEVIFSPLKNARDLFLNWFWTFPEPFRCRKADFSRQNGVVVLQLSFRTFPSLKPRRNEVRARKWKGSFFPCLARCAETTDLWEDSYGYRCVSAVVILSVWTSNSIYFLNFSSFVGFSIHFPSFQPFSVEVFSRYFLISWYWIWSVSYGSIIPVRFAIEMIKRKTESFSTS